MTRTSTSPAVLLYYDGLLRLMRDGGFSYDLIHHALHALGSRALGFTQELFDPSSGPSDEETAAALAAMTDQIPHLVAMFMQVAHDDPGSTLGWCDDQTEFEFGLDLILDGLDKMRKTASPRGISAHLHEHRPAEPLAALSLPGGLAAQVNPPSTRGQWGKHGCLPLDPTGGLPPLLRGWCRSGWCLGW
jgi:hypothetical protein